MTPCHSFSNPRHRQLESRSAVRDGNGAARGIRTPDPLITNEVLYQLSYCGVTIVRSEEGDLIASTLPLGKAGAPLSRRPPRIYQKSCRRPADEAAGPGSSGGCSRGN